jgi:glucose dehydrogenase
MHRRLSLFLVVLTVGLVGISSAAARTDGWWQDLSVVAPAFTGAQLAAQPNGNYIGFQGSSWAQGYTALSQINTSNVANLKEMWHVHLGSGGTVGVAASAPGLVYNGVMYICTGTFDIYALDARRGSILWHYDPTIVAANTTGGRACRGLAMGDGKIYSARNDGALVAIDQLTGAQVWQIQIYGTAAQGYYQTAAPAYYDGMVITGIGGGENGIRGNVAAFSSKDGTLIWRSFMIPAPGEPGSETWAPGSDWQHAGGPVWVHPVIDPQLNMVYVGTGNAAPYNGRPAGDNLFTASIVALNAHNGNMVWYYQTVHHDIWDDDIAQTPVLFNRVVDGKAQLGIASASKMGYVFLLDRTNGKPIIATPEVAQPQDPEVPGLSLTQPIPGGTPFAEFCATEPEWLAAGGDPLAPDGKPYRFGCDFTPLRTDVYTVPGWHDDADWPPSSYNPATHFLYVCSTNNRGDGYKAIPLAQANLTPGKNYTANVSKVAGDWIYQKWGVISAVDIMNNGINWQRVLPDSNGCYTGTTTTAGGLVFAAQTRANLLALDAATGKTLWQSPLLDADTGAPPFSYAVDGQQFVAALVGGSGNSAKSTRGDSLYAFALPDWWTYGGVGEGSRGG